MPRRPLWGEWIAQWFWVTVIFCSAEEEVEFKPLSYGDVLGVTEWLESEFGDNIVKVTDILRQGKVGEWKQFTCVNDARDNEEE